MRSCAKISVAVMHMQDRSALIAGQNFIVPADVQRMHIMHPVPFVVSMNRDVNFSENVSSVQL